MPEVKETKGGSRSYKRLVELVCAVLEKRQNSCSKGFVGHKITCPHRIIFGLNSNGLLCGLISFSFFVTSFPFNYVDTLYL